MLLNSTARRFNETNQLLRRFVVFPDQAAYDIATLWIMHTHVRDANGNYAFDYTPRLALLSDGPGSGKTVALDKVSLLANRGKRITSPTAPAVTMMISTERLTPCIDEIDELFGKTALSKSDLRALLNSGYERGGTIARANKLSDVFGPVSFAGMGANFANNPVLRALRSRTIAIWMRPKEYHEKVEVFRRRFHEAEFNSHNDVLAQWGKTHVLDLQMADPDLPVGVENRDVDLWAPLLSISELAGDDIAERGRVAVLQYVSSVAPPNAELGDTDRLIVALAQVFNGRDELDTKSIVDGLFAMPHGVWQKKWFGDEMAAYKGISEMLSTVGASPERIRITDSVSGSERQVRGYRWSGIAPYVPQGYEPPVALDDLSDLPVL